MHQLQGMDSSFVALETRNSPMHIGSILIYDPATAPGGFVRFKDILAFYQSRLQFSKTVRQRLVRVPFDLDYPYWVEDEHFDLEYHVRHVALPQPGDWRQLCIQAARIFARPLDLSRPPWEFTVVEGLGNIPGVPPGSFAMVTKVHHAAIDGMSGIDLMEALHSTDPHQPPPNEPDNWKPEKVPSTVQLLARSWLNNLRNPLRQVDVAARAMPGLFSLVKGVVAKDISLSGEMIAPRSRFNVSISPHRVVEGRSFPLADIKAIHALAPGSKVNDVFLAIIGGAMRRYLLSKGDLPDKTLTAMAPISVRSQGEKGDMGNQVAAMVAPLGTHIEDPAERLRYVHSQTMNSKAMTEAIGARNMTEMSKVSPALFMALGAQLYTRLGLANRVVPPFTTVVTNVPGPPVPIYSAGARLHSMMGLVCLTDGMGLAHVVQSYVDEATIAFTADRDLMPDPDFYAQCLADSFADLLAATRAPAAERATPRKKAEPAKEAVPPKNPARRGTKPAAASSKPKTAAPAPATAGAKRKNPPKSARAAKPVPNRATKPS
ncbi:wax ester/triacylglycerol synthase family O-acyltransferase [Novosphingobium tardum]|uniref:diacylglycerol O-acyltransferase n=1 Tax=Novosphingobium tardum TaxID=1538021 RepID=A0ABV8RNM5_9SPHN